MSIRERWRLWCFGGEWPIESYPRWDYALRFYGYTSPIHLPITIILAAAGWWLE